MTRYLFDKVTTKHCNFLRPRNLLKLWILFIGTFHYAFFHKAGQPNQVANALSKQSELLMTLQNELQGVDILKDQYTTDRNFQQVLDKCMNKELASAYNIQEGFLFYRTQLCIPHGSLRDHLLQEFHSNSLSVHLGHDKTIVLLKARFYWPHLR